MSNTEELPEVVEKTAETLVEAKSMGDAAGLYISKGGLARLGLLIGLGAVGVSFATYKVTEKRIRTKYDEILKAEIAEAKAFYSAIGKTQYPSPEDAVADLMPDEAQNQLKSAARALAKYHGNGEEDVQVEVEEQVNVFMQSEVDDIFIEETDIEARSPFKPYIVSRDEFMENDGDFTQVVYTYYAGDGALATESDEEIIEVDNTVGTDNLDRFGYGSGDARVVYIRNERLSMDFEVLLHDDKYSNVVIGLEHADGGVRGRRQAKTQELRRFKESLDE